MGICINVASLHNLEVKIKHHVEFEKKNVKNKLIKASQKNLQCENDAANLKPKYICIRRVNTISIDFFAQILF